jgi:hypothetical protein
VGRGAAGHIILLPSAQRASELHGVRTLRALEAHLDRVQHLCSVTAGEVPALYAQFEIARGALITLQALYVLALPWSDGRPAHPPSAPLALPRQDLGLRPRTPAWRRARVGSRGTTAPPGLRPSG